ncbi:MAG: TolC family protein [Saprospiraceae bacterium]|nr:TolC family protein [Saprospiraceae bacterium]
MQLNFIYMLRLTVLLGTLGSGTAHAQATYSLQKALQTARANNPVLAAERLNIGVAEADVATARLHPNPMLNNQTLQLLQSSAFPSETRWYNADNRQVWWQLTKVFPVAGQRRNQIATAQRNVVFTEKLYAETERNLYLDVASKWLEAWAARKQLDVIESAQTNLDSLLNANRYRYEKEVISQTDLFRTELLAKQFALQAQTARQDLQNRQQELRWMLGTTDSVRVDTADAFAFALPTDLESLLAQGAQARSDVQAGRALLDLSESNLRLQKSLAVPQPEVGFIWNPQNTLPYFGIYATMDLPLFNRNQGEIQKSNVLKEQARRQLDAVQSLSQTEIAVAFADYRQQGQNVQAYQPILEQSQVILDNVRYAYLRGGTTIVDYLEAQRSWLETRQQYYDTVQAFKQSHVRLLHATGFIQQLAQQ